MHSHDAFLEIENLTVGYGGAPVLNGLDLSLQRGQLGSLIGPNGAGKSTLLKTIAGLLKPAGGQIRCSTQRIGYVPQQLPLDRALPLTVGEFLSLKLRKSRFWFGGVRREDRPTLLAGLDEIGAAHLMDRQLGRLSGGELQRILIAYALLNRPELLLLDEPLTGVDIRGGLTFDGLLHHLHDHLKMTILMVSHDLHLVEHLSDTVFCINGELCCHGDPDEVLRPENLAKAYGHLPGCVRAVGNEAFIPVDKIR